DLPCRSYTLSYVMSRSANTSSSTLADFVAVPSMTITNCPLTVDASNANIQIGPATATGLVGTNHTLTGHVNLAPDGSTFSNAPAGTLITFSKLSGPGTFVGGNSCGTIGAT